MIIAEDLGLDLVPQGPIKLQSFRDSSGVKGSSFKMPTPSSLEFILVSLAESSSSVSRDWLLSSLGSNCLVCVNVPRTSTETERFLFLCSAPHPWIMWTSLPVGALSEPAFHYEFVLGSFNMWLQNIISGLKRLAWLWNSFSMITLHYFLSSVTISPLCPEHPPLCLRSGG